MKSKYAIIIFIFVTLFVSCSAKTERGGNDTSEITFRKYILSTVYSLDPSKSYELATTNVIVQLYDSLFELNSALEPVPHLVENYAYDHDGKLYEFQLKKNIHFTNGKELTSDDVIFTFKHFCRQKRGDLKLTEVIEGCANFKGDGKTTFGVKHLDKYRFSIKLISHYPPFLTNLASHTFSIFPANFSGIPENEFWKKPITTGAYQLERIDENSVTLKANKNYFLGKPNIDLIKYMDFSEEKALEMARNGELDDTWPFILDNAPNSNFKSYKAHISTVCFLGFNLKKFPYNNISFRKAIASLINRDRIVRLLNTDGIKEAVGFVPYGVLGYMPLLEYKSYYDIKSFGKYIKLAGFDDVKEVPTLNLFTTTPLSLPTPYLEVKKQLEEASLKVNVREYSLTELVEKVKSNGPLDFTFLKIRLNQPETYHLLEYFRSNYSLKLFDNSSKEFDSILDASQKTDDRMERGRLYQKANKMITENVWAINLFYDISRTAYINKKFNMPAISYLGPEFTRIRDITVNQ